MAVAVRHLGKLIIGIGTVGAVVMVSQVLFLNGVWRWAMDALPEIIIRDGEASSAVPQPRVVERTLAGRSAWAVVIDTTGKTQRLDEKYSAGVLVRREGLTVNAAGRSIDLSFTRIRDLTIDRAFFQSRILGYPRLALYVLGLYAALSALLSAQALCGGLVGYLLARLRRVSRGFAEVLKMSIYALVLSFCFVCLVFIAGVGLGPSYLLILYVGVHLAFLSAAVLSWKGEAHGA
ncbi:MAG: DUF1189 family protein [Candidatus Aureabacteria bacterium]|nr:DUF1189 family protein [Candidatus Auribacterota bacterium]